MKKTILKKRSEAVQRYLAGENSKSIYSSLRKSKAWLYKWVKRYHTGNPAWCQDQSRQPRVSPYRTTEEIEEIVKMVRLNLYNKGLFCGDQAILILSRHSLTRRRTGRCEPKGKPYTELPALVPNQTHQMDLVGPCYLQGPIRF